MGRFVLPGEVPDRGGGTFRPRGASFGRRSRNGDVPATRGHPFGRRSRNGTFRPRGGIPGGDPGTGTFRPPSSILWTEPLALGGDPGTGTFRPRGGIPWTEPLALGGGPGTGTFRPRGGIPWTEPLAPGGGPGTGTFRPRGASFGRRPRNGDVPDTRGHPGAGTAAPVPECLPCTNQPVSRFALGKVRETGREAATAPHLRYAVVPAQKRLV